MSKISAWLSRAQLKGYVMYLYHPMYGTLRPLGGHNYWENTWTGVRYGAFTTATYGNYVCLPLCEVEVRFA